MPNITPEALMGAMDDRQRPRRTYISAEDYGKMLDQYYGKPSTGTAPAVASSTSAAPGSPITPIERVVGYLPSRAYALAQARARELSTPMGVEAGAERFGRGAAAGAMAGLGAWPFMGGGLIKGGARAAGWGLGAGAADVIAPGTGTAFVGGKLLQKATAKPIQRLAEKLLSDSIKLVQGRPTAKMINSFARQYKIPRAEAKIALSQVTKSVPASRLAKFAGRALPIASNVMPYAMALPPLISAIRQAMAKEGSLGEKALAGVKGAADELVEPLAPLKDLRQLYEEAPTAVLTPEGWKQKQVIERGY